MAKVLERREEVPGDSSAEQSDESPHQKRADRWMLVGALLCGSFILGPLGLPLIIYSFVILRRAERAGEAIRPWSVTIIGTFCLVDAAINFVGWGTDLLPVHDTTIGLTLWSGYGRLFDGAYYIGYNGDALGGTSFDGEKAMQLASVLLLFPMRIAAAWGFLKMKRWGLQHMIVTAWLYVFLWLAYATNMAMDFTHRHGASHFGLVGFWIFNFFFFGAFIMLPYLYTVNRERWSD